ncbi:hypothetical protein C8046_12720 [Serinibacter arcticus]|uniref:Rhodanese domain-containing protein n=1 Tax=Serinibacter arcticus TaxID=1655435 RepID=A0A2U1ZWQ3_9MICO|nr:ThiF family adenylyltransferase [Serinibacter arcticus]PWD51394.1 hypothetical protein C8046_12720 [Serinibacter arcticus]
MRLPPLVEPGPALAAAESLRTSRQTLLPEIGESGQRRLAAARVLVIGAGGLGAPVLAYLAAAGVGTIGIVDDDVVDLSNLHRQVIHSAASVGEPKVASAARRLRELAPDVAVVQHGVRLDDANATELLTGWDLVLDGTDTFPTRYLVSDTCAALGVPVVWGSVLRFDAQVSVFWSQPPGDVAGITLRDLFPEPPAPGTVPSCAEAGVLGALCGIVGAMMATEAIKLIVGAGDVLLGRVAVVDALTMRIREVPLVGGTPARERSSSRRTAAIREPERSRGQATVEIGATRYLELEGSVVLLDVREPAEFAADALAGAVNVPISALGQAERSGTAALATLLDDAGVPADATLVTYCAAGIRSVRALGPLAVVGRTALALTPAGVDELRTLARTAGQR